MMNDSNDLYNFVGHPHAGVARVIFNAPFCRMYKLSIKIGNKSLVRTEEGTL